MDDCLTWAYCTHGHHFYPKWLGGMETGPQLSVRGFEHIVHLEPELLVHMQRAFPGIERTAESVRTLIKSGRATQEQITQELFKFYKARYPQVEDEVIMTVLRQGLE